MHLKMAKASERLFCFILIIIVTSYVTAKMFYILHWSISKKPHLYLGPGQKKFIENNCKYTNCYVTSNKTFFKNKKMFDAIIFDASDLVRIKCKKNLPSGNSRSDTQKYIFTSIESDVNVPLCLPFLNIFFNWTWTYKLDSDFRRGYITIYNKKGNIVGPMANKKWKKHMRPIDKQLQNKLQYKSELAAWMDSNCRSRDNRRLFVNAVQEELRKLRGQEVDIFSPCGRNNCPIHSSRCDRMLKKDYFFYFAFENSFSKDYVTEKLMTALEHYNVPVVFGGADYNRFLPPGSYLNAHELGPANLARRMLEIKSNLSAFFDFFRWRNHLVYKDTTNTDTCKLCAMMNKKLEQKKSKDHFVKWWNDNKCPLKRRN